MTVVARAGTIPFKILPLVGRRRQELPGGAAAWTEVRRAAGPIGAAVRLVWEQGRVARDGEELDARVYARLFNDVVWAVGVDIPGLYVVAYQPPQGEAYLTFIDKTDQDDPASINWITVQDGQAYNLGTTR